MMPAYAIYDAIEQQRNDADVINAMREEEEKELSEWFSGAIKPRFIQSAVLTALGSRADEKAVNNAFDVCSIEELVAEFTQKLSDEIARQQQKINDSFRN
ncbi:host-nuclease inhibitor Gam family protein [Escherichia coli]|nr:host-nuclease inhibitor Gam family protein [Escherichia coli]MDY8958402.1 host-nuclease inhibitor Gam family protein [Escherichia coli]MDY8997116.1 host-nuclease inhibitor Gam family protein [Escherichia coli]MDY9034235.1 host-nuclease inhibitor Gam family protein [Escherichia coli]